MALDKAIEHGKEKRKPFRGSKAVDISCRNHGGKTKRRNYSECPWCKGNRLHSNRVKGMAAEQQLKALEE